MSARNSGRTHFGTAGWLLTVILFVLTLTSFEWGDIALGGVAALALIVARLVRQTGRRAGLREAERADWKQGVALGVSLIADVGARVSARRRHVRALSGLRPETARDRDVFDRRAADSSAPFVVYRSLSRCRRTARMHDAHATAARYRAYQCESTPRGHMNTASADESRGAMSLEPFINSNRSRSASNWKCRSSTRTTMI